MTNPTITFINDPAMPDVYVDVTDLPSPFTLDVPIAITNTHPSARLYYKASIDSPPADYSTYSQNLGYLDAGGDIGWWDFLPVRDQPVLVAGEYDEYLTLRIDAYTDAGYSSLYATKTLAVTVHFFNHTDPSWTVIHHATFDQATTEGWAEASGAVDSWTSGYAPIHLGLRCYSPPYGLYSYNNGLGPTHTYQLFNTSGKTKARFVIHWYQANYGRFALSINGVLVKPRALFQTPHVWLRNAFNVPIGASIPIRFDVDYYSDTDHAVDEIWVIAK